MGIYDEGERYGARELDARGFLGWVLWGLDSDLAFSGWLETQSAPFPGEPGKRSDLVAEFTSRSGTRQPWAAVVELQGQPRPWYLVTVWEYALRLFGELRHGPGGRDRYWVMTAVVNLSETAMEEDLVMTPPMREGQPGRGLVANTWVVNVRLLKARQELARMASREVALCILIWVPLMEGAEDAEVHEEWKRLAGREPDRNRRATYAALALLFAEMARRGEVWKRALEEWDVEESPIVKEWTKKAEEKAREEALRSPIVEEWKQQAAERAREEALRSPIVEEWKQQAAEKAREEALRSPIVEEWKQQAAEKAREEALHSPIVEEWKQQAAEKAREEALQRGREEGREEGRLDALRSSLMQVLRARFGEALSEEIVRRIEGEQDLTALAGWIALAIQAESAQAFHHAILPNGPSAG
jgi:hypothetical protein